MPLGIDTTEGLFFRDYTNLVVPKNNLWVLFIIPNIFKHENSTKTKPKHKEKHFLALFKKIIIFTILGFFFTTLVYILVLQALCSMQIV